MGVQKHTNRRITVLNKLFMKNITDLMATGAMAESITGLGIEVSRVRVSQDFQNINVYWLAKGSEDDVAIDQLLRKCSGHLRHELSQLRVMGEVPRIHFVKDLEFAKYVEVERILKGADKGNPEDDESLDDQIIEGSADQIPEMRNDVLGLNHDIIFSKIQNKLRLTKVAWSQFKSNPSGAGESESEDVSTKNTLDSVWEEKRLSTLERENRFAEFLKKKRLGKIRNETDRADREFLMEQHAHTDHGNDDHHDYEEEQDIFVEDITLNNRDLGK